jgi:hypothetical protein
VALGPRQLLSELVEGLIGSGQTDKAAAALDQLRADSGQVGYLRPALAWLEGWLTEQRGAVDEARRIYQDGEDSAGTGSPVYAARLLLADARLLRRTGNRPRSSPWTRWGGRTGWPGTRCRRTGWWPAGSRCGTECSFRMSPYSRLSLFRLDESSFGRAESKVPGETP